MRKNGPKPIQIKRAEGKTQMSENQQQPQTAMDRAMFMSIEFCSFGTRRKVKSDDIGGKESGAAIETDADRELVRATKSILESATLKEIRKADSQLKEWINRRSLPSNFRAGIYAIPDTLIEEVDGRIEEYKAQRTEAVRRFIETELNACMATARERLGPLFDEKNYPTPEKIAASFDVVTEIVEIIKPGKLSTISRKIYDREVEKAKGRVAVMEEGAKQFLRARYADLVTHLLERLTPGPSGAPKIFRNTAVTNVEEFIETFEALNITNDVEMAALVERTRSIIGGVAPETLRDDTTTRERVTAGFSQVRAALDSMMTERPKRVITFDDDDTPAAAPVQDAAAA